MSIFPPSYKTKRPKTETTLDEAQKLGREIQRSIGATKYREWVSNLGHSVIIDLATFKASAETKLAELRADEAGKAAKPSPAHNQRRSW